MDIKKGDTIVVRSGKDRAKKGKVVKTFPREGRIMVEQVNLVKKHVRPRREGEKGETVTVPRPLRVSNVMLICPSCNKPTRIAHAMKHEKKVRACKKCKHMFA